MFNDYFPFTHTHSYTLIGVTIDWRGKKTCLSQSFSISVCIFGKLNSVRPSLAFRLVNLQQVIIMTAIIIVRTNHHLCSVMSCKRCHQAHSSLYQPIKLRDQLVGVNKEERARIMTFCPALFTRKLTKISSTLGASSKTHQGLISAAAFVPGRILKYMV